MHFSTNESQILSLIINDKKPAGGELQSSDHASGKGSVGTFSEGLGAVAGA